MTPEERVAAIPLHWIQHDPPITVDVTFDLSQHGKDIIDAIRAAVAEEREACAMIVENCWAFGLVEYLGEANGNIPDERMIAAAIRARGE